MDGLKIQMENTMFVYLIRNQIDGKVYIGQCYKQSLHVRWKAHCKRANWDHRYPLHQAIRVLGKEKFSMEILQHAESRKELHKLEKQYISEYRAFPPELGFGYNLSEGGPGSPGFKMNDEQIRKIALASRGRKFSEEHCRKIGLKSLGNKSFLGRKHSEETKQRMRVSKLGTKLSEEVKESLRRDWHKNHPEECIEKMRLARLACIRRKTEAA